MLLSVRRAYLELLRPANVATALADVLAGASLAGLPPARPVAALLAATACLYAGGVVLNDYFDRDVDARERPERPIPSGRVPAGRAAALGVALLASGVGFGSITGRRAALTAAAVALAVLLYDAWGKRHAAVGPINMGLCRALNLMLGMTAAVPLGRFWALPLVPWTYIAAVTVVSRGEVLGGSRRVGTVAFALIGIVTGMLAWIGAHGPAGPLVPLVLTAWFAARVLPAFWRARQTPEPATIRAAVRIGVLSLVVLDAVIASAYAGMIYALAVLATALLAGWLARRFAVT
jgi:4-hydroxybenzoate polyprenyltransferase